jgi:hypothetical protein
MRDVEARGDLHAASLCLGDRPLEVGYAVDQDRLIVLEVAGEQQCGGIRAEAHHRHPSPQGLDREHQLGAQSVREVLDVGGNVTAGEIDEVEPIEHHRQATPRPLNGRGAQPIKRGISSSVIPNVTDQLAMARLPHATHALMISLLPAVATVIGIVVLGRRSRPRPRSPG